MASNIPADLLARKGKFYEQFGRQMMFFKCSKMMTDANCVMKELSEWTEYIWGTPTLETRVELGLPKDCIKLTLWHGPYKWMNKLMSKNLWIISCSVQNRSTNKRLFNPKKKKKKKKKS